MNNQIVRVGLTLLLSMTMLPALIGQATVAAKDPQSTPAAISHLPSGALGVQIQWLLDTINTPANVATADPIEKHVSPVLLARITAEQLAMDFLKLNAQQGLFTVRPDSIVTSRDVPATIAIFVLVGHAGDQIRTSMTIDRDSGLITALNFQLGTAATPVASPDTHITLPQGALGEQIQWLLGMIGGASPALSHATIAEHFTPGFLAQLPSESLMNVLNQLVAGFGPLQIEDGSLATSRDNPPTSAMLIVQGKNHARFKVSIAVDRDSGLISGLLFQPALAVSPAATAIASPIANGAFVDEFGTPSDDANAGDFSTGEVYTDIRGYDSIVVFWDNDIALHIQLNAKTGWTEDKSLSTAGEFLPADVELDSSSSDLDGGELLYAGSSAALGDEISRSTYRTYKVGGTAGDLRVILIPGQNNDFATVDLAIGAGDEYTGGSAQPTAEPTVRSKKTPRATEESNPTPRATEKSQKGGALSDDEYLSSIRQEVDTRQKEMTRFNEILAAGADATSSDISELTDILVSWSSLPTYAAPSGYQEIDDAYQSLSENLSTASANIITFLSDTNNKDALNTAVASLKTASTLLSDLDTMLTTVGY